jgi:hypothetical protein
MTEREHARLTADEVRRIADLGDLLDFITDPIGGIAGTVRELEEIAEVFDKVRSGVTSFDDREDSIIMNSLLRLALSIDDEAEVADISGRHDRAEEKREQAERVRAAFYFALSHDAIS